MTQCYAGRFLRIIRLANHESVCHTLPVSAYMSRVQALMGMPADEHQYFEETLICTDIDQARAAYMFSNISEKRTIIAIP